MVFGFAFSFVSWKSIHSINQKTPSVSLSLEKQNKVLYIGIDNPFVLTLCGISHNDIVVTIDNGGSIESNGGNIDSNNSYYTARVKQEGQVTITINHKKEPKKEIGKFVFRVKPIPDPVVKIGGFSPGAMPLGVFKVQKSIRAQLEGFAFHLPIRITSYEFIHVSEGQPSVTYKVEGAAFSPTVLESMKRAKVGDYIILDTIVTDFSHGRTLPTVIYRLI